jgi:hypothetical protein
MSEDHTVESHALLRVLLDENMYIHLVNSYLLKAQERGYFDGLEPGTEGTF